MPVAFQAQGTGATSATGNLSVAWPAHQAGDIGILVVSSSPGGTVDVFTTQAGFQQLGTTTSTGTGTAGVKIAVFWCRATSSAMANPVIQGGTDYKYGTITTYRGAASTGNPFQAIAASTKATGSTSTTMSAVNTSIANTLIIGAIARDTDVSTGQMSSVTNANLTGIAERVDGGTTNGGGGGHAVWDGMKAAAGNTGTTAIAWSATTINAFMTMALIEEPTAPVHIQTATGGSATAGTVTAPVSRAAGDLLLLYQEGDNAGTATTPTGWTLLTNVATNGTQATSTQLWIYARIATGTSADDAAIAAPGDHRLNWMHAYRYQWSGVTADNLDVATLIHNTASTMSPAFPTVTTTSNNSVVMMTSVVGTDTYSTNPAASLSTPLGGLASTLGIETGNGGEMTALYNGVKTTAGQVTGASINYSGGDYATQQKITSSVIIPFSAPAVLSYSGSVALTGSGTLAGTGTKGGSAQRTNPTTTGLTHQYRANDLSIANGSEIDTWAPTVGTGTLSNAGAGTRPILSTGAVNGKKAANWTDGADDQYLYASNTGTGIAQPVTYVTVLRPGTSLFTGTGSSSYYQPWNWGHEFHTDNGKWRIWAGSGFTAATNIDLGEWQVVTTVFNGASSEIYVNGTLIASGNAGTSAGATAMYLGRYSSATRNWRGDIAEVLRYDSALDSATRAEIHSYVQDFYGITVSDYIALTPPSQDETGSVGLSGSGTATFTRTIGVTQPVSLSGSGTTTWAGVPKPTGAVALSGSGTTTWAGVPKPAGPVALSGSGTTTWANTTSSFSPSYGFTGSGTLSFTRGAIILSGAHNPNGSGTLAFTRTIGVTQTEALDGSGTVAFTGVPKPTQTEAFDGEGTLATAPSGLSAAGANQLSGDGTLTLAGEISSQEFAGTVALNGSGTLTGAGTPATSGATNYTGSGTTVWSGTALHTVSRSISFTGDGTLTLARGPINAGQTVALNGSGTFTGSGTARHTAIGTYAPNGEGTLAFTSVATPKQSLFLTGSGTLVPAISTMTAGGNPGLNGSGTLARSGTATVYASGAVALSGSGTLTRSTISVGAGQPVALTGSGTQTRSGTSSVTSTLELSGAGTLALTGSAHTQVSGAIEFSGDGELVFSDEKLGYRRDADFDGSGTLTYVGEPHHIGSGTIAFSGDGTLTREGTPDFTRTINLTGSGTLGYAGVPRHVVERSISFSGSGTTTWPTGIIGFRRAISFDGEGTQTRTTLATPKQTLALSGPSTLEFTVEDMTATNTYGFTGNGTLVREPVANPRQTLGFTGSGTLTRTGALNFEHPVWFSGSGDLVELSPQMSVVTTIDFTSNRADLQLYTYVPARATLLWKVDGSWVPQLEGWQVEGVDEMNPIEGTTIRMLRMVNGEWPI